MPNSPLVSILIPVYNRERIVVRALESAINQTYKHIEIICVDNCSTDNTYSVLLEYANRDQRIKVYRQSENLGPVRNWKTCLEKSTGDYIKFLWSDDIIHPNAIERMIQPILQKNVGFVYSCVDICLETQKTVLKKQYHFGKEGKYASKKFIEASVSLNPFKSTPVSPGCALFHRETIVNYLKVDFENTKGMDFSRFGAGNDLYLFYGACNDYESFYYIDEPLCVFYGGKDSFSISNNLIEYYDYVRNCFVLEELKNPKIKQKYCTISNLFYKKQFLCEKYNYSFFVVWIFLKIIKRLKMKIASN